MGAKNFGDLRQSNLGATTQTAMSDGGDLMFTSDPRRFSDLVRTDDPAKRISGLCGNFALDGLTLFNVRRDTTRTPVAA
jgi:hypothetical protein